MHIAVETLLIMLTQAATVIDTAISGRSSSENLEFRNSDSAQGGSNTGKASHKPLTTKLFGSNVSIVKATKIAGYVGVGIALVGLFPFSASAGFVVGTVGVIVGLATTIATYALYRNGEASLGDVALSGISSIPIISIGRYAKLGKEFEFLRLDSVIGGTTGILSQSTISN